MSPRVQKMVHRTEDIVHEQAAKVALIAYVMMIMMYRFGRMYETKEIQCGVFEAVSAVCKIGLLEADGHPGEENKRMLASKEETPIEGRKDVCNDNFHWVGILCSRTNSTSKSMMLFVQEVQSLGMKGPVRDIEEDIIECMRNKQRSENILHGGQRCVHREQAQVGPMGMQVIPKHRIHKDLHHHCREDIFSNHRFAGLLSLCSMQLILLHQAVSVEVEQRSID